RPISLAHRRQPLGHLVERLIPGDARPLPLAARSGPPYGIEQAVAGIGDAGRAAYALDAEGALRIGVGAIGHEVSHTSVAHCRERSAAGRALPAGGGIGAVC